MTRVLLLMSTRTYKADAFLAAAARLQLDVVVGTDRLQALSHLNPQGNLALPFHAVDQAVDDVRAYAASNPLHAVVAADDDGALLASAVGAALALPHHPAGAVRMTTDKLSSRRALRAAGLRAPDLWSATWNESAESLGGRVRFPCVLKPRHLSASRGVMRADDMSAFIEAHGRLRAILEGAESRPPTSDEPDHDILVERFIPGAEVAVEALMHRGKLRVLALFDKPDPLDGPFFEETIYVTPSRHPRVLQDEIVSTTRQACEAFGLHHGAVHAELRVNDSGAWLLEAAPRSIGGLCSRALTFGDGSQSLEELLLQNALGQPTDAIAPTPGASGVMMIPIPKAGILSSVGGVEAARSVAAIEDIRVTVPPGELVQPAPEGARYLGFIFARGARPELVEQALRSSHAKLHIQIEVTGV